MSAARSYRKVQTIAAEEFLAQLRTTPRKQLEIFIALGGDPRDHNYARLSFLTQQLRAAGYDIRSSRRLGVWLGPHNTTEDDE